MADQSMHRKARHATGAPANKNGNQEGWNYSPILWPRRHSHAGNKDSRDYFYSLCVLSHPVCTGRGCRSRHAAVLGVLWTMAKVASIWTNLIPVQNGSRRGLTACIITIRCGEWRGLAFRFVFEHRILANMKLELKMRFFSRKNWRSKNKQNEKSR